MTDIVTNTNVHSMEVIPPVNDSTDVVRTINQASKKLAVMLANVVDDLTTLEVRTYTSEDLENSTVSKLRAKTTIKLDGDIDIMIPERKRAVADNEEGGSDLEVDEKLWAIHNKMVDIAQTKRVQFIKTIAEVAYILAQGR